MSELIHNDFSIQKNMYTDKKAYYCSAYRRRTNETVYLILSGGIKSQKQLTGDVSCEDIYFESREDIEVKLDNYIWSLILEENGIENPNNY